VCERVRRLKLVEMLKRAARSVSFAQGLRELENDCAKENCGFRFPPDLREFLQTALPIGFSFPDWRLQDDARIRESLWLLSNGALFDVGRNDFLLPDRGIRPTGMEGAKAVAIVRFDELPRLTVVFGRRMIPDQPHETGDPISKVKENGSSFSCRVLPTALDRGVLSAISRMTLAHRTI